MYMTRVTLKSVPQPNDMHTLLLAAFGAHNDKAQESLWRVDDLGEDKELLIVSASIPELQQIVTEIGNGDESNKTLSYAPFLERIECAQVWNFRLCANPVEYKKKNASDKRGKICALRSAPEQLAWLDKQSAQNGFDVKDCSVISSEWRIFKAEKTDKKNAERILAATFEGVLNVTNADAFRTALVQGVGLGKSHGCGLLTIAKDNP